MKNPLNKLSKINKLSLVLMSLLILDSLFTSGLLLTGSSFLIGFVSSFGFGSIIVIGVRFVTVGGVEVLVDGVWFLGMLLGVVFGKFDGDGRFDGEVGLSFFFLEYLIKTSGVV